MGMELLRLLCESIGLQLDYFEGDLSGGDVILNINHYPPCPNPPMTLGQPPHCDRDLITLLLLGAVHGLEIAYKGDWIKVKPEPNALVVNFGQQLEVVTKWRLSSCQLKIVSSVPRRSSLVKITLHATTPSGLATSSASTML